MIRMSLPSKLAVGSAVVGATIFGLSSVASAHDFVPSATTAACSTINGEVDKVITVTVTNQYDLPATAATAAMSGSVINVPANGSNTYTDRRGGSVTGTQTETVVMVWSDGFRQEHPVSLVWGSEPCHQLPPVTAPPSTPPTTCPPGTHPDGPVSPCAGDVPTTVPPVATSVTPTTVRVCEDGKPPSVLVEDGSYVCPEFFPTTTAPAKATSATVKAAHPVPASLPVTGADPWVTAGIALVAALVGTVAVLITRRRKDALD